MALTPKQNYFVLPMINWLRDNGAEPYITVVKKHPGVEGLPDVVMKQETPVVTLGLGSVRLGYFNASDKAMLFSMRFSGREAHIVIPYEAVLAVFDRATLAASAHPVLAFDDLPRTTELKLTFDFDHMPAETIAAQSATEETPPNPPKKPGLRVVK